MSRIPPQTLEPIFRGEPAILTIAFPPGSPPPDDWTVVFTVATERNADEKTITKTPEVVDGDHWEVSLTTDDTDIEPGLYAWDIWRTDASSELLLAIGSVRIRGSVRLPASA